MDRRLVLGLIRMACFVVGLPWLIDAGVRLVLARASRRWVVEPAAEAPDRTRWLVVVPSRSEGDAVAPTLESIEATAAGHNVQTVLLLDGADEAAMDAVTDTGASTVVKEPAGPTKGAALSWLVTHHAALLDGVDAVLVVDVGSCLAPGFFDGMSWPPGMAALQAWLRGAGGGVGDAAALSERAAQMWQDRGRQALGWAVQLRGTGMAFTPAALKSIAPRLRTSTEDTEATLLLDSDGQRIELAGEGAVLEDVKPTSVADAASQRSRWLLGQLAIFVHQPAALSRLLVRRPVAGLAFVAGLLSRPLSLTALFRFMLALGFLADAAIGSGGAISATASGLLILSLVGDVFLLRRATEASWGWLLRYLAQMLGAWCGALVLFPKAMLGWARARRK